MKINEIGSLSIWNYELYRKRKQSAGAYNNVNEFQSIRAGTLWEGWREEQGHLSYLHRLGDGDVRQVVLAVISGYWCILKWRLIRKDPRPN